MAASELFVYYAQEIRPYSLFVFLAILSYYYYLAWLTEGESIIPYTVVNTALSYTHPFAAFLIASQSFHYIWSLKTGGDRFLTLLGSYGVTLVAFSPWIPVLLRQAQRDTINWLPSVTPSLITGAYGSYLGFLGAALLLVAAWYWRPWSSRNRSEKAILVWMILPSLLLIVVSTVYRPVFHRRYLIFTIPAVYLVISIGVQRIRSKLLRTAYVSIVALSLLVTPVFDAQTQRDDWAAVSQYLETHRSGNPVFVQPYYEQQPLTYYYNSKCFTDDIYACNKADEIRSITKYNCCGAEQLDKKRLEGILPPPPYWLILTGEDTHGKRMLQYSKETHSIDNHTVFPKELHVYRIVR